MRRDQSFDTHAELYHQIRPGYPAQLFDDLIQHTGLTPDDLVLEVGSGTGKATIPMIERGFTMHCIEPGCNMSNVMLKHCPSDAKIEVYNTTFEQLQPQQDTRYRVIMSAQAWHWVTPEVRYTKSFSLLQPDGYLALMWYLPVRPKGELADAIDGILEPVLNPSGQTSHDMDTRQRCVEEIQESNLFTDIHVYSYKTVTQMSAREFVDSMNTQSNYAVLDEVLKQQLDAKLIGVIEQHGGAVANEMIYTLYIAQRE